MDLDLKSEVIIASVYNYQKAICELFYKLFNFGFLDIFFVLFKENVTL